MATDRRSRWLPLAILAGALVIWTSALAIGAYLEWGADQPRHDIRKPLIMLASLATFLGIWGMALWLRWRRSEPKAKVAADEPSRKLS